MLSSCDLWSTIRIAPFSVLPIRNPLLRLERGSDRVTGRQTADVTPVCLLSEPGIFLRSGAQADGNHSAAR